MTGWPLVLNSNLALYKNPKSEDSGPGFQTKVIRGKLTFGAGPLAGLGGRAAAVRWRTVPKGTTAQGGSKQVQGAWVQTEGLELLCQKAEALGLAAALALKLSNPGLEQDPL